MTTQHPAIKAMQITCHGAPFQIEGTLTDGRFFYFRSRHRHATLGIGAMMEEAVGGFLQYGVEVGKKPYCASWIEEDEALKLLGKLLDEGLNG